MFFIPKVSVVIKGTLITVSGLRSKSMLNDIARVWKTQRINLNMFERIGSSSFTFEAFFALEICYIFESIIANKRSVSNVRLLKDIINELYRVTWLGAINAPVVTRVNLKKLSEIAYTLYPYQLDFLKTYDEQTQRYSLRGMLLGAVPGSGKTAMTLALSHCLGAERVVIFCPKVAVERVWVSNIITVFEKPQTYWFYASGKPFMDERFAIFHYEALDKALDMVKSLKRDRLTIILDESHNLAEMTSLRTQSFLKLCEQLDSKDTILASGTPIKAITNETLPLFYAVDRLFNENVATRFKAIYRGEANRATEILTHRLNQVSFKIDKAELGLLPPIFTNLPVQIPNGEDFTLRIIALDLAAYAKKQIAFYNQHQKVNEEKFYAYLTFAESLLLAVTKSRNELAKARRENEAYHYALNMVITAYKRGLLLDVPAQIMHCNAYEKNVILPLLRTKEDRVAFKELKTLVKYMKLKVQGECLGRVLGRKRIDAHVAMVPYIDFETILNSTEKKTVVFTSYVEVLDATRDYLAENQCRPLTVYGKVNKDLVGIVNQFEKDALANPLIATYASLSTAVPLIMADVCVMINSPFRNYIMEQAVSRIHRLGADTQTHVYICALDTGEEPNISSRNVDILKWSQEQVEMILGIDSTFKIEDVTAETQNEEYMALNAVMEELAIPELIDGLTTSIQTPSSPIWTTWQ